MPAVLYVAVEPYVMWAALRYGAAAGGAEARREHPAAGRRYVCVRCVI